MLKIEILSLENCADTPPTIDLIKAVAAELNIEIKLSHQLIFSPAEAESREFPGSPTVLINGVDIEPEMRFVTQYGFT